MSREFCRQPQERSEAPAEGRAHTKPVRTGDASQVQHALAREHGHESWKAMLEATSASLPVFRRRARTSSRFLEFAPGSSHPGKGDHRRADLAAQRLPPSILPSPATHLHGARVAISARSVVVSRRDRKVRVSPEVRGWTPLLYLCFTRFTNQPTIDNAIAIGRLLLDNGANPNDFYMAGSARYTALVGAAGEGEQASPRQPWAAAMFDLLLERGAKPFDQQVLYNTHFSGEVLWWLELVWKHTKDTDLAGAWRDPEWLMLDMGNYGTGASFLRHLAERKGNARLREWLSAHGANSTTPPKVVVHSRPAGPLEPRPMTPMPSRDFSMLGCRSKSRTRPSNGRCTSPRLPTRSA